MPVAVVVAAAALVSAGSFWYSFSRGMSNVYSDGVAHVNIARKVVDHPDDSYWQRYIQIGTPWLPLQTVLMVPFAANDHMWRTGAAGSIVSMLSFVFAAAAIYLIARNLYRREDQKRRALLSALAAGAFVLNPSALYMQTTPMSELPFVAGLTGAIWLFQRWLLQQTTARLVIAGLGMSAAALGRYEAWPVAALAALLVLVAQRGNIPARATRATLFGLAASIGPLYWLWHNWAIYDDPLAFLRGPHSARSIYLQHQASLGWAQSFSGKPAVALLIVIGAIVVCAGLLLVVLSLVGLARLVLALRRAPLDLAPVLLLLVPLAFHVFSVYRGEIQIFPLSAFGLLNVRYGLPHIAVVCLLAPAAAMAAARGYRMWPVWLIGILVLLQYALLLSDGPSQLAIYQEAFRSGVNSRTARKLNHLSANLRAEPPRGVVLMYTGALGPAVPRGGLRFAQIIHEGTMRWHQITGALPSDVTTVIIQTDDPLDHRLRGDGQVERQLASEFRLTYEAGGIRRYERVAEESPPARSPPAEAMDRSSRARAELQHGSALQLSQGTSPDLQARSNPLWNKQVLESWRLRCWQ
jgi:hypothetical protein